MTTEMERGKHKRGGGGGYSSLTTDLLKEILVRIPAKSLFQLRSVCKLWHELISESKSFARLHLHHHRSRSINLLAALDEDFSLFSLEIDDDDNNSQIWRWDLDECLKKALTPLEFTDRSFYLDSCDGLLLFKIHSMCWDEILLMFVCNPVTRTYRILPDLPDDSGDSSLFFWKLSYDAFFGQYYVVVFGAFDEARDKSFVLELPPDYNDWNWNLNWNWKEFPIPVLPTHNVIEVTTCPDRKLLLLTDRRQVVAGNGDELSLILVEISKGELRTRASSIFTIMHDLRDEFEAIPNNVNGTFHIVVPIGDTEFNLWTLNGFQDRPTWTVKRHTYTKCGRGQCFLTTNPLINKSPYCVTLHAQGTKLISYCQKETFIIVYDTMTSTLDVISLDRPVPRIPSGSLIYHVDSLIRWK